MWWRHRKPGRIAEADHAIEQANRGKRQAAEEHEVAVAKLAAERRFFGRILAAGDADSAAAAIEESLRGGGVR